MGSVETVGSMGHTGVNGDSGGRVHCPPRELQCMEVQPGGQQLQCILSSTHSLGEEAPKGAAHGPPL